jgi:hypothetical protein
MTTTNTTRDWSLPVEVVTQRFWQDGKWITAHVVLGSNLVEVCRCDVEQTAHHIACAVNKMPCVPTEE